MDDLEKTITTGNEPNRLHQKNDKNMASNSPQSQLTPQVRSLLAGLRWRIRFYVLLEGLSLALVWVLSTFLLSSLVDHMFLWFFSIDLPLLARGVVLAAVGTTLAVIFYLWILRRIFVRLADRSMAVLLERHNANFKDSLVTMVEMNEHPDHADKFNVEMLLHSGKTTMSQLPTVQYGNVFRYMPVVRNVLVAFVLLVLVGLYASVWTSDFLLICQRWPGLSSKALPTPTTIAIHGTLVETRRLDPADAKKGLKTTFVGFKEGRVVRVAENSSLTVVVIPGENSKGPLFASLTYYAKDGKQDTLNANSEIIPKQDGIPKDMLGYSFGEKPFRRIASPIRFSVVGRAPPSWLVKGDLNDPALKRFGLWPVSNRVRGYRIKLVKNPEVTKTELDCDYPLYLHPQKEENDTLELTTATRVPQWTKIKVRVKANKPLQDVIIRAVGDRKPLGYSKKYARKIGVKIDKKTGEVDEENGELDLSWFEFEIASLEQSMSFEFGLQDQDGVISEHPFPITIPMLEDTVPQVETQLVGIGSAVTAKVKIPFSGTITDDNRVERVWVNVRPDASKTQAQLDSAGKPKGKHEHTHELDIDPDGKIVPEKHFIDFHDIASLPRKEDPKKKGQELGYPLVPGKKLQLWISAQDRNDISKDNTGVSDEYQLDIVTPDQLLDILGRREISLRQRLEQIISEIRVSRIALASLKPRDLEAGSEPEDNKNKQGKKPASKTDLEKQTQSVRRHLVEATARESRKSALEVLGVSDSFKGISSELVNNRIDLKDRKDFLKNMVTDPLDNVGNKRFGELAKLLDALEKTIENEKARIKATDKAIAQVDDIILELDAVLQQLLRAETIQELIRAVGDLVVELDDVTKETIILQKDRLKGLNSP